MEGHYIVIKNSEKKVLNEITAPQTSTKKVSIILPTYNEEGNIGRLIDAISVNLTGINFEIVVVDDNSKDKTPEILDSYAMRKDSNVVAVHRIDRRGIFSAIIDGIKLSNGEAFVIMDSDFSHPPAIIPVLIQNLEGFDMTSGSRFLKNSGIEAPFFRKYGTIALNIACRIILGLKYTDLTGGFHAINKEKFIQLKFKYPTIWGEFDMELFYRAVKAGFKIKEVPFTYKFREEGASKSENLLKYGYTYIKRALQLAILR